MMIDDNRWIRMDGETGIRHQLHCLSGVRVLDCIASGFGLVCIAIDNIYLGNTFGEPFAIADLPLVYVFEQ